MPTRPASHGATHCEYPSRTIPRTFPYIHDRATYLLSVLLGIFMVHSQNHFALARRDKLVAAAQQSQILTQLNVGHPFRAATLDFAGNLVAGISSSVSGFCVPLAYPMVAYRGWVGGIVSVDSEHKSRVIVLLMQIFPYSRRRSRSQCRYFAVSREHPLLWPALVDLSARTAPRRRPHLYFGCSSVLNRQLGGILFCVVETPRRKSPGDSQTATKALCLLTLLLQLPYSDHHPQFPIDARKHCNSSLSFSSIPQSSHPLTRTLDIICFYQRCFLQIR